VGNGGTVLHIIFKTKSSGITSVIWDKAEVLAHDGSGTNILTNLQNHDLFIEEELTRILLPVVPTTEEKPPFYEDPLVILNIALMIILGMLGIKYFINSLLRSHDKELHRRENETKFDDNGKT